MKIEELLRWMKRGYPVAIDASNRRRKPIYVIAGEDCSAAVKRGINFGLLKRAGKMREGLWSDVQLTRKGKLRLKEVELAEEAMARVALDEKQSQQIGIVKLKPDEKVEITLQDHPPVRILVSVAQMVGKGKVIEVRGLDSRLEIMPTASNQVFINSDQWDMKR